MVIEGPKAGGHLGFAREELEKITDAEYEKEIQGIMEVSKEYGAKYGYHIPVVVAGGIYDGTDMENALKLGGSHHNIDANRSAASGNLLCPADMLCNCLQIRLNWMFFKFRFLIPDLGCGDNSNTSALSRQMRRMQGKSLLIWQKRYADFFINICLWMERHWQSYVMRDFEKCRRDSYEQSINDKWADSACSSDTRRYGRWRQFVRTCHMRSDFPCILRICRLRLTNNTFNNAKLF